MTFLVSATATGVIQALARADLLPSRTVVQTVHRDDAGTGCTIYTVTAGKTLYVTTLCIGGIAAAGGGVSNIYIGDNCTAVPADGADATNTIAVVIDDSVPHSAVVTFASPMKFTNSVKLKATQSYQYLSCGIIGWEE